jgi:hypothetical protein
LVVVFFLDVFFSSNVEHIILVLHPSKNNNFTRP